MLKILRVVTLAIVRQIILSQSTEELSMIWLRMVFVTVARVTTEVLQQIDCEILPTLFTPNLPAVSVWYLTQDQHPRACALDICLALSHVLT